MANCYGLGFASALRNRRDLALENTSEATPGASYTYHQYATTVRTES